MPTLNIIGGGHVGQTLAALFHRANVFTIGSVCNRSLPSASRAVAAIGRGLPAEHIGDLPAAAVFLIGTGDDAIEPACTQLAESADLSKTIVFHCSGSLPSSVLDAARRAGAATASVHPIKSFTDVPASIGSFRGTFCGTEGDESAVAVLSAAFTAIGGTPFPVDPAHKALYHAAAVFAMNYIVVLVETALRCYERAGVPRPLALQVLTPMLSGAAAGVTRLGPADALTGPIARGDSGVVERHLDALGEWDAPLQSLYAALGAQAVTLSERAGHAAAGDLQHIRTLLDEFVPRITGGGL